MKENVFCQVIEKVEGIEEKWGSLENFVLSTTNLDNKHNMIMEDIYSSNFKDFASLYQQFEDMEIADLVDFQEFIGRFDG